jgi:hypothetical protein
MTTSTVRIARAAADRKWTRSFQCGSPLPTSRRYASWTSAVGWSVWPSRCSRRNPAATAKLAIDQLIEALARARRVALHLLERAGDRAPRAGALILGGSTAGSCRPRRTNPRPSYFVPSFFAYDSFSGSIIALASGNGGETVELLHVSGAGVVSTLATDTIPAGGGQVVLSGFSALGPGASIELRCNGVLVAVYPK